MIRIKLPGNEKHKKIILIIFMIIAIGILFYEARMNLTNKKIQDQSKSNEKQSIIEPLNSNEISTENKSNEGDKSDQKEKNDSSRENELYNEAYTLFFSKQYDNAINTANELIRDFPSSANGYNIRGISKAYSGDYEGGMKDIDKALEINSNYGYARFNKALTYELYGDMDKALEWYNKDLEIEDYVWTYYGISSIYGRRGDVVNTMKYLNKAIQIDKSVKETAKEEQDFEPVRNSKEFQSAVYN
ncbi:tetratricopeptide repeat protein [Clostridium saccharobutylicum]|uniref:Tetratricopeptide TPR_1 repeat-containing protein n=1 Tax=Clostridium saccharobutylicum DSM 13864 TaxID=1345695 RepID=U5ML13_CLOSA|nr:hypothetical protein [Clostridium saccharobutylicum]AGX41295.1 tetratricopeptide TPR_1 repeat-containing protein [Clostridium saccharobutylicum DSM 13864]AQR88581.1 tetratricopeptide repeat protein [Clostridium saccharobutylicum]AQR98479.1 tetratricopeptide repeat protein [Clostridium saccharobutylicum]AQS08191.1 tetratricopeptide repeat protein [Clostridium saccharobutylicum]AQS12469.1 tetratricopeptide repeat protein [Clostridium saccharobutylicum]